MLYFNNPQQWKDIIKSLKINKEDIHEYGLEKEPHCTICWGFDVNNVNSVDVEGMLKSFHIQNEMILTINKLSYFNNKDFDVLKFDVKHSLLNKLNAACKKNFDIYSTYPNYNPHITIGYLKKGTAKKYVGDVGCVDLISKKNFRYLEKGNHLIKLRV